MKQSIYTFHRTGNDWRWRQQDAANLEIIGASTEGYKNIEHMLENFTRVTGVTRIFSPTKKHTSFSFIVDR